MPGTRSSSAWKPGDLLLVSYPFTDLTTTKQRPAVVLSPSAFHHKTSNIVICMVTRRIRNIGEEVSLDSKDLASGNLPYTSVALVSMITTLHNSLVVKSMGRLKPAKLSELRGALAKFLDLC